MRRTAPGFAIAVVAVLALAACAPEPAPAPAPSTAAPAASPSSTPTPSATAAPEFRMPERCAEIVTAERSAAFAAAGLDLLGGPEGRYGEEYFAEPTPEERAGGLTCVWGDEDDVSTTIILSVAPVSMSTRSGIVRDLLAQGLNEATVEGATTYAQLGDDVSSPAILNVVRTESWISVIMALGGQDRFQEATELVDEATALVYVAD